MRFAALAFVLALSVSASAREPAQPERRAEARAHFEKGARAYEQRRYKRAIDEFLIANRILPSPALSFNIARAYERLGDDAAALGFYRDYLRRAPNASDKDDVQKRVHRLELVLRGRGVQQVTVMSTPERATVVIDGEPVGVTPWTGEIAPGQHRVVLRLAGHRETQSTFTLPSHRAIDVELSLEREAGAAATPTSSPAPAPIATGTQPPPERSAEIPRATSISPLTWTAFGVGALCLGGALAAELRRGSLEDEAHGAETQREAVDTYSQMESWQTGARVLAGAGVALTAIGGVLLYLDLSADSEERVGVSCQGTGCTVSAVGRF